MFRLTGITNPSSVHLLYTRTMLPQRQLKTASRTLPKSLHISFFPLVSLSKAHIGRIPVSSATLLSTGLYQVLI